MVMANTSPLTWLQIKLSIRDEAQIKYWKNYSIQEGQKFTFKPWLGHLKLFDMAYSVLTLTVSQLEVSK